MIVYRFFDTDPTGWAEYDIAGEDYGRLIELCFRYCTTMAFQVIETDDVKVKLPEELEQYRLPVPDGLLSVFGQSRAKEQVLAQTREIRHYRLCPEVKEMLLCMANSLFHWAYHLECPLPDNPAFFRADGSVFFCSDVHEGWCTLAPRSGEDISEVLSHGPWRVMDRENPACGHDDTGWGQLYETNG